LFGDLAPDDKKSVTAPCKSPLALAVATQACAATDIRIHLIATLAKLSVNDPVLPFDNAI
jgi:hypothetical protein